MEAIKSNTFTFFKKRTNKRKPSPELMSFISSQSNLRRGLLRKFRPQEGNELCQNELYDPNDLKTTSELFSEYINNYIQTRNHFISNPKTRDLADILDKLIFEKEFPRVIYLYLSKLFQQDDFFHIDEKLKFLTRNIPHLPANRLDLLLYFSNAYELAGELNQNTLFRLDSTCSIISTSLINLSTENKLDQLIKEIISICTECTEKDDWATTLDFTLETLIDAQEKIESDDLKLFKLVIEKIATILCSAMAEKDVANILCFRCFTVANLTEIGEKRANTSAISLFYLRNIGPRLSLAIANSDFTPKQKKVLKAINELFNKASSSTFYDKPARGAIVGLFSEKEFLARTKHATLLNKCIRETIQVGYQKVCEDFMLFKPTGLYFSVRKGWSTIFTSEKSKIVTQDILT